MDGQTAYEADIQVQRGTEGWWVSQHVTIQLHSSISTEKRQPGPWEALRKRTLTKLFYSLNMNSHVSELTVIHVLELTCHPYVRTHVTYTSLNSRVIHMSKNTCHTYLCAYVSEGAQHWWYGWWSRHHWYSFLYIYMTIICILLRALSWHWTATRCFDNIRFWMWFLLYWWWVDIIYGSLWLCCSFFIWKFKDRQEYIKYWLYETTWIWGCLLVFLKSLKYHNQPVELLWWEGCRNKSRKFNVFGESSQTPWNIGGQTV